MSSPLSAAKLLIAGSEEDAEWSSLPRIWFPDAVPHLHGVQAGRSLTEMHCCEMAEFVSRDSKQVPLEAVSPGDYRPVGDTSFVSAQQDMERKP